MAYTLVPEQRDALASKLSEFGEELDPDEQAALAELILRAEGLADHRTLAQLPPEALFDEDEIRLIEELDREPTTDVLPPNTVLIMKSTRLCNLRCTYCNAWREGPNQNMTFEVLARVTHGVLRDSRLPPEDGIRTGTTSTTFVWHGGEPLLRNPRFYVRALWLQHRWRIADDHVSNVVQTNGSRISAEYIELCQSFGLGIGVSLDGPPEIHDQRRLDAAGRPTHQRVREGLNRLQEAGLGKSVIMVLDEDHLALGPRRVLEHLDDLGVENVSLLNLVPGNTEQGIDGDGAWLHWARYLTFMRDLFQIWYHEYRDQVKIRELSEPMQILTGEAPTLCIYMKDCFRYAFDVDPEGTVTGCDKYVGDSAFRYGSVLDTPVSEVMTNAMVQIQRDRDRHDTEAMSDCRWFHVCQGGCPHDRDVNAAMGVELEGCCGLGPLLDDMDAIMQADGIDTSSIDSHYGHPEPHSRSAVVPVNIGTRRQAKDLLSASNKQTK